ncbi:MAG TPA: nuclear transport factor 2 family protein [Flavobacteriales bacterium]|nr:nuclear transport factor 2 family protein [Flavobacteriales bacterium]
MQKHIDPKTVALQFNDCINNRDLNGLLDLMTNDHTFIDTANNSFTGKDKCKMAWNGFFDAFPDYHNIFEIITSKDTTVIIQGHSVCSDKMLEGTCLWTAKIKGDKVTEWRVYTDNKENRILLGVT